MPKKYIHIDERLRIVNRFLRNPTIDLGILAQKEGVSRSTVYKTLNQDLLNWRDIKQEVFYVLKFKGIFSNQVVLDNLCDDILSSQKQEQTLIDKNQDSMQRDITNIQLIRYRATFTKREQKLMALVIKLQREQSQMEGRIKQLEKKMSQNYEKPQVNSPDQKLDDIQDIVNSDNYKEFKDNQLNPSLDSYIKCTVSQPIYPGIIDLENNTKLNNTQQQADHGFKNHQQKQQNRLRISLGPKVQKPLNRSIDFTHQIGQFVIPEKSAVEVLFNEDYKGTEIENLNYYQEGQAINLKIHNANESNFELKLESLE